MKKIMLVLFALVFAIAGTAVAASKGTPDQAKALAESAAEFFKANGLEKSIEEFNKKEGKFVKGDLYVFVLDFAGVMRAHPMNPKLVGKNLMDLKDVDGKPINEELIKIAKGPGKGWVDYKWTNPETKMIQAKTTYVIRIGDALIGSGAYK